MAFRLVKDTLLLDNVIHLFKVGHLSLKILEKAKKLLARKLLDRILIDLFPGMGI